MFAVAVKYQTIDAPSIWFYKDGWSAWEAFFAYVKNGYNASVRHTENFAIAENSATKGLTVTSL